MAVHEVVGTQHAHTSPAPPCTFGGAGHEFLEHTHQGSLGPSDTEATLLQLGRMSSKYEVAFIFTLHDGSERSNVEAQRCTSSHPRYRIACLM